MEAEVAAVLARGSRSPDIVRGEEFRGALAVWSDQLQLAGHPRGELIALDLREPGQVDRMERKRELLSSWIGQQLASVETLRFRLGFFDVTIDDETSFAHASRLFDAGGHVMTVRIRGGDSLVSS